MQSKDVLFLPNLHLDLAHISTKLSQRSKDSDSDGDSKDLCAFDRVCVPGPSQPSCGRQKHRQPEHVLKRLQEFLGPGLLYSVPIGFPCSVVET